ncbi:hypothetical protein F2P56_035448, partial [Juglans regia]
MVHEMSLPDGRRLISLEDIHNEAVNYFTDFLAFKPSGQLPVLSHLVSPMFFEADNIDFCKLHSIQEIKETIFSILVDSSLGSDGFGLGFFRSCWDIVGKDVVDAIQDFFKGTPLLRYYLATSLVLIPKVDHPMGFDKFRPISLCTVISE